MEVETEFPEFVTKFSGPDGLTILTGQSPDREFIKTTREGTKGSRLKSIKYKLGDSKDVLECKVKLYEADGSETRIHRWYTMLKEPESAGNGARAFLLALEVPEEKAQEYATLMQTIQATFRLAEPSAAPTPAAS